MGRSLGSASVLELAATCGESVDGLIVESGFAYAAPLLQLLGIDLKALGFKEEKGFRNIDKIRNFDKPTLIIHAEFDHIIPFSDGEALYDACPSPNKTFLKIPGANHNDIFMRGLQQYLAAVKNFVRTGEKNHQLKIAAKSVFRFRYFTDLPPAENLIRLRRKTHKLIRSMPWLCPVNLIYNPVSPGSVRSPGN